MDENVYSLAGRLIRELRDKIKADVEKEVYGLTAGRGRDMKVRVDRLEGEVESLHSVIKLKEDRLTWWRQTVDERNRTIEKLEKRVEFLTFYPPHTRYQTWEERLRERGNMNATTAPHTSQEPPQQTPHTKPYITLKKP